MRTAPPHNFQARVIVKKTAGESECNRKEPERERDTKIQCC